MCQDKQTESEVSLPYGFSGLGSNMLFRVQFSLWDGQGRSSPSRTCPITSCPACPGEAHFSWDIWLTLCPDNIRADIFACFFFSFKCNSLKSFIQLNELSVGHFYNKHTKAESAETCHRAKYVTGRIEFFPSISFSLLSLFCLFFGYCNSKSSLF